MIGQSNVSVPTHFFKVAPNYHAAARIPCSTTQVIVGETEGRELEMEAFVLPNQVTAI